MSEYVYFLENYNIDTTKDSLSLSSSGGTLGHSTSDYRTCSCHDCTALRARQGRTMEDAQLENVSNEEKLAAYALTSAVAVLSNARSDVECASTNNAVSAARAFTEAEELYDLARKQLTEAQTK